MYIRRMTVLGAAIGVLLLGSACGAAGHDQHYVPSGIPQVEAQLRTEPNPPKANAETRLYAELAGLDSDADVTLEIRADGQEQRETLKATPKRPEKPGVYTFVQTFKRPGTYQVVIHLNTPEFHQVFNKELQVLE